MERLDEIRHFVVNTFMFGDDHGLTEHTSFLGSRVVDSTGMLELISFVEERYKIRVEDHELTPENLDSLQKLGAFVARKLEGGQGIGTAPAFGEE